MSQNRKKIYQTLNPRKVWVPVAISLGFVVYKILTDEKFSTDNLSLIFSASIFPLVIAAVMLVIREMAYIYRLKFLSDNKLSLTAASYIILLWEFASAVTPSVVGGTPVAVFLLMKEGITMGKSLAYAMVTAIFDNLYLVILSPIFYILYYEDIATLNLGTGGATTIKAVYFTSYTLILFYTFLMCYSLFVRPRWFKWLMIKLTSFRWTRKWKYAAYQQGNEVMIASKELKGKGVKYWWRIAYTTFFSWTARFALLNFIVLAFIKVPFIDHLLIFGKQIVLWVFMLASPTPGSSGIAEIGFEHIFDALLGEYTPINTLLWRIYTYFTFLLAGVILLPRWISRVFNKKKIDDEAQESEEIEVEIQS